MPNYTYICDKKHKTVIFEQMKVAKPEKVTCTTCEEPAIRRWTLNGASSKGWPYFSDAMGCGPDQINETAASLTTAGIHAEFDSEGSIKVLDNEHRNQLMRHFGLVDRNGGHAQHSPNPDFVPECFRKDLEGYVAPSAEYWNPEDA